MKAVKSIVIRIEDGEREEAVTVSRGHALGRGGDVPVVFIRTKTIDGDASDDDYDDAVCFNVGIAEEVAKALLQLAKGVRS